jgi:glycosyltransferase involved in cell wall biosynthesis
MLKGYQHFAGRALVGIRALERCADALAGYTVVLYSPSEDVRLAAELFAARSGVELKVIPQGAPRREILAHHGRARVSMGLSIGDGISTSFLEALVMGALPVQSDTACACEWARDGEGVLVVPPEDPERVEQALRRALADDALVDRAAAVNWATAQAKLDQRLIAPRAAEYYERVVAPAGAGR